jgi:hypothetical protein
MINAFMKHILKNGHSIMAKSVMKRKTIIM